jgi:hypothetical protein
MRMLIRRMAVIVTTAVVGFAITAIVTPAVSFADCRNGEWWDPVANVCQPLPVQPLGCENGWWWDPVANVCRPPVGPRWHATTVGGGTPSPTYADRR